ncbi:hypothetical protein A2572_01870 [Candidatus Collierbacteria bacterium RIFOXYD1_FULL_40_9]|uniref:Glutamyl-tRNA amidotransferase n=1 Tax=Candidatus Collierbacteria bacterium RIFOXYD1_FULL_40_9 TaxID=1817731 RepID=A0A1F5FV15_9BACT|nr:MAG: hypothetical protein A2572_01870 [Candidatus Collierbacteria bacterium RIFOXYD1_FULL_40_9]
MFNQLKQDLLVAKKGGDTFLLGVLKLLLSELSYAQVDFKGGELPDTEVIRVLFREAKKRKDSIEVYTKIGSVDKVESEKKELEIIERYLPKLMSEAEVEVEIAKIASESGITGGRLMGIIMGRLKGKVDGGVVQRIVNEKYK